MTSVSSNIVVNNCWRHICPNSRDLTYALDKSECLIELPKDLRIQGCVPVVTLWIGIYGQQNGFLCDHLIVTDPTNGGVLEKTAKGWLYFGGKDSFTYQLFLNGEYSQPALITLT